MISLKNYILEQEISDASVGDIALEQAIADFEVSCAIMECYLKSETIMENCDTDIADFNIFMEADAATADDVDVPKKKLSESFRDALDKAKSGADKAVDKIKNSEFAKTIAKAWNAMITAFGQLIENAKKSSFGKLADRIEKKCEETDKFEFETFKNMNLSTFENLQTELLTIRQNNPTDINKLKALENKVDKSVNEWNATRQVTQTRDEFIKTLRTYDTTMQRSSKTYGQLKKALDLKNLVGEDEELSAEKKKELLNAYKGLARNITKYFSKVAKHLTKIYKTATKQRRTLDNYNDEDTIELGGKANILGDDEYDDTGKSYKDNPPAEDDGGESQESAVSDIADNDVITESESTEIEDISFDDMDD